MTGWGPYKVANVLEVRGQARGHAPETKTGVILTSDAQTTFDGAAGGGTTVAPATKLRQDICTVFWLVVRLRVLCNGDRRDQLNCSREVDNG